MKCYAQFFDENGNFGAPWPDDVEECNSILDAMDLFCDWVEEIDRYGDKQGATGLIWLGEAEGRYPADCYPDFQLSVGPCGGLVRTRC